MPKDAMEEMADDELASFVSDLSEVVREIDRTSTGKNVEDVIKVGEAFDPNEVCAHAEISGIGVLDEAKGKKAFLEDAVAILRREEEDRKNQKAIMDGITEALVEGDGARIETMSVFDDFGKEDQWGLRWVRLNGKFNFIDRENRILFPRKMGEWFDEVTDFQLRGGVKGVLSAAGVSSARCGNQLYFLGRDGECVEASLEKIESFNRSLSNGRGDSGFEKGMVVYWETFAQKLDSLRRRYPDNPKVVESYGQLASDLVAAKGASLSKGWGPMLVSTKGLVEASGLPGGHKAHLFLVLRSVAEKNRVDPVLMDTLFPIPKKEEGVDWMESGHFGNGLILRSESKGKVQFNLMDLEGRWVHAPGSSFDSIGHFTGGIAWVRRDGKTNFLNWENGSLVSEAWFPEVGELHAGMYRVSLGKTFNFMGCDGKWLSPMPFDEAEDFDERGRARVRSGEERYSIDAKGNRVKVMTDELSQMVKDIFRVRSERRLSKEEMVQGILAIIPETKEVRREPDLDEGVRRVFGELLAEFPENGEGFVTVFGDCRRILNTMAKAEEAQGRQGRPSEVRKASVEIEKVLIRPGMPAQAKDRLRQFFMGMESMRWKEVDRLPVPMTASFGALLRGNPKEEVKLIRLLRDMESKTNTYSYWSKEGALRKLLPDYEVLLARAGLEPATRQRVREIYFSMMGNRDAYWQRGLSVGRWQPATQEGRALQEKSRPITSIGVAKRLMESRIPDLDFALLCENLSKGDLAAAEKAVESFGVLVSGNPGRAFDHGRMGLALFGAMQRLQKEEPEATSRLLGAAIEALEKAVEGGSKKAQIHFVLGQLCEYRARAGSRLSSWIPLGKRLADLNRAADSYGRSMESSPNERLKAQIDLRDGEVKAVLRRRSRVRLALLVALGLATAGALAVGLDAASGASDPVGEVRNDSVAKPVEPKREVVAPKPGLADKSKGPKSVKPKKTEKPKL
jgi:hypothetical protein